MKPSPKVAPATAKTSAKPAQNKPAQAAAKPQPVKPQAKTKAKPNDDA